MLSWNCNFATNCAIKNFRLDLIRKAIETFLDNPSLSNREVARQIGTSEQSIRYWKKQLFWEQERQKLINERAEAMGMADEKRREEYKEKLQKQQQDLEKLRDAIKAIAARMFKELCEHPDPVKACSILTKSGVHIQSKIAIDAVLAIVALNREILQFYVVLDYLENLNDDEAVSE